MKLADTTRLLAGGVGSGCHGENCGRRTTAVVDKGEAWAPIPALASDAKIRLQYNGRDIGYAEVKHSGNAVRVIQTHIDPLERGKGFGKELYQHILDYAKARGFSALRSDHGVSLSEDARRVWESMRRAEPDRIRKRSKGYVYQIQ